LIFQANVLYVSKVINKISDVLFKRWYCFYVLLFCSNSKMWW